MRQRPSRSARVATRALLGAALRAQAGVLDPQCEALSGTLDRPLQDACQKSVDIVNLVAPQLGPGIAGGNAVLGGGAALGGLGRISLGVRSNFVRGRLPRLGGVPVSTGGAVSSDIPTTEPTVFVPTADAALGLFGGVDLGPVRVGGLDALASVTYVPDYDNGDVAVRARDGRVRVGYGARLGLVQESALVPGLGVTYLRRDLPASEVLGRVAASAGARDDTIGVVGLRTRTDAWRAVASKTLAVLTLTAGAGQDRYRSRARVGAVLNETVPLLGPVRAAGAAFDLRQSLTRTNYFAGLSLTLPVVVLSGEAGRVRGGSVRRGFNSFDGRTDRAADPVTYYAAGVRLRF